MSHEVQITTQQQETQVPEVNGIKKLDSLLRRFGKVTAETRIGGTEVTRPLSLRTQRAQMYHDAMKSDTEGRKKIFAEAHARDKIAKDYLNQGKILVDLPGLGSQEAQYVMIEPPESRKKLELADKPPIFLIPGISNDIDCVGALAQEIPFTGRSVVVVGFPDSFMGTVTDKFADAVNNDPAYGPHAEFYKQAIKGLLGDTGKMELWGFSTGSPIAAEILSDPEFQNRVTDAVLLSPASVIEQSPTQLNIGVARETTRLLRQFSVLGKYTLSGGREAHIDTELSGQREVKKKTFNGLIKQVRTKFNGWNKAKVQDGGTIKVVSGERDEMTRSYLGDEALKENPQVQVVRIPDGIHATPLIKPAQVLQQIM